MTKIVIFMEGGVIHNVIADGETAEVYVVDYDTEGVEEDHPHLTKLDGDSCLLFPHGVEHAPETVALIQKTWEL